MGMYGWVGEATPDRKNMLSPNLHDRKTVRRGWKEMVVYFKIWCIRSGLGFWDVSLIKIAAIRFDYEPPRCTITA